MKPVYTEEKRERRRGYTARWVKANRTRVTESARAWLARNPDKRRLYRERYRAKRYGLTPEAWQQLFLSQDSKCAICSSTEPRSVKGWHTDHCHSSGKVRGILCHPCNLILGHAKEDATYLLTIAAYLGGLNEIGS
jgi:hypothetical protein